MRPRHSCLVILLICCCGSSGAAASFECSKAITPQEKAICRDPKLSQLDESTATAYKAVLAEFSPTGAAEVQRDQRKWLQWLRQVCPDQKNQGRGIAVCLTNEYTTQLQMLKTGVKRVGGMRFFPRVKVLIAPDTAKPQPGSTDPGFGVGRFSWPEIDQPTPQQAAWNAAVRRQVVSMSSEAIDGRATATEFKASNVADSEMDVSYRLKAANERFISVDLENSTYGYGAAHPNEYTISFEWWMELHRALKADDIFRPGSGWEAFLGQLCYEKLRSGEHAKDLYNDNTARRAVLDSVKQINGWTLTARRFEVDFAEYSVAPRAAGSISVALGWEQLKPYLASGFDPATLPQPVQ